MIQVREREVGFSPLLSSPIITLANRCIFHHFRLMQTMYAGVIRDDARLAAKKLQKERELEFQDQAKKRAYLEGVQKVSNPVTEPMKLKQEEVPKSAEGLDFGCKTCEKP